MTANHELRYCRPVAGAQPVETADAARYDARWRVLDAAGRPWPADDPALADVAVQLRFGYLVLRAPGMLRLDVPLDVIEDDPSVLETIELDDGPARVADEGAWAAEWFSKVLGRPARLVKVCSPA